VASNIKPTFEVTPDMASRVMDWLNIGRDPTILRSMPRAEVALLRRGDALVMNEATMGVCRDGCERIFAPGTRATFWLLERFGPPTGWAATLVIGGSFDGDVEIVNCFYESDPAGFPFQRADDERRA